MNAVMRALPLHDSIPGYPARPVGDELRQTVALLHTIIEAAPGMIYAKDVHGRLLVANNAALELIGKPWAEVAGRTGGEFLDDALDGAAVMENDRLVLDTGLTHEAEEVVGRKDGVPRIVLSTRTPLRAEDGAVLGLVGVAVDITRRKAAEAELQRLNATLEERVSKCLAERDLIWRHSLDLLLVLGFDGVVQASNPAWLATLGYRRDELVGQPFDTFMHPDDAAASRHVINQLKTESVPRFENRCRCRTDGSWRWISWTAAAEGDAIYCVGRDVTMERQQAEALAQTEAALRQSQKMEAVGQLTGGIAHDFNNMLQHISSGVEMMRRRIAAGQPQAAEQYLDAVQQGVSRAAALTNRLLAFSRRQALAPTRVVLDDLVSSIAGLVRRTVGPSIEVRVKLRDGCWAVKCDSNQLENALLNLAINARDAMMPGGGKLLIETDHVELDRSEVAGWDAAEPGAFVRLRVTDSGGGMPPDVLEHVFEPFFTTKPAGQGTGLGLSQVFGFISQSHGIVQLDSEVGRGTTVALFLPRYHDVAAESAQMPEAPAPALGTVPSATVLLVEDEAELRRLVAEALRELGWQVVEAADGATGLSALRDRVTAPGRRIDMLVADVGLPGGLSGRQLADVARTLIPGLPVLLVTGYDSDALARDAELEPGVELLGKPFTLQALAGRVRAALVDQKKEEVLF